MGLDKKVIDATTVKCPAGRTGIVTTTVYNDGEITYNCSSGVGSPTRYKCIVPTNENRPVAWGCKVAERH